MEETILILDCGSQYTQLIARRIRELNIYCEIHPYNKIPELANNIKGVIISGSPFSVHDANAPQLDLSLFRGKYPLLAICYGAQYLAKTEGGKVVPSEIREYGRANLTFVERDQDFCYQMNEKSQVWMSHGDTITEIPEDFVVTFSTKNVEVAGFRAKDEQTFGIQFHPEVFHTTQGKQLLSNFSVIVCHCSQNWTPASFADTTVASLKVILGKDKVIMGLSGGVDSSVAAVLLQQAIGDNLYCIFVDNGLLRKNEYASVLEGYKHMGLNVLGVDAKSEFYKALDGLVDPEEKRKAIGKSFIDIFQAEAKKIKGAKWLGQGTIYPDVIESMSVNGPSATIKSHHNVGGLPELMDLKVVEPLRSLFKDEVRRVGKSLKVDSALLDRHPFPGPGLGIRILGAITPEKVQVLQEVDYIFINALKEADLYKDVWQAGSILLPVQSVGVMGDERTYENAVALRAVTSTDGMTADWAHLPHEFLAKVSSDIINKVKGINRVVYDISSKPPATIEWE